MAARGFRIGAPQGTNPLVTGAAVFVLFLLGVWFISSPSSKVGTQGISPGSDPLLFLPSEATPAPLSKVDRVLAEVIIGLAVHRV